MIDARERRLPFGALVLYQYFAASPTDPVRDERLVLTRRGLLLRGRVHQRPSSPPEAAPSAWVAKVHAAIAPFCDEPPTRELLAPEGAGLGPTCSGSHHALLVRRGFLRTHTVLYAHFDWTGTTVPPLLRLLEDARTRTGSYLLA